MTAGDVARALEARQIGAGRWMARCPAHDDHTPSLSIAAGNDGRTLLRCWAGCETDAVIQAAGLSWADLFPPDPSRGCRRQPRQPRDPRADLRRRAEKGLKRWAEQQGRILRDEIYQRNCLITLGENVLKRGDETGWNLLGYGYRGLDRDEYLLNMIESKNTIDVLRAYRLTGGRAI